MDSIKYAIMLMMTTTCKMYNDCSGYKLESTYIKTTYMNMSKENQLLIFIITVHGKTF